MRSLALAVMASMLLAGCGAGEGNPCEPGKWICFDPSRVSVRMHVGELPCFRAKAIIRPIGGTPDGTYVGVWAEVDDEDPALNPSSVDTEWPTGQDWFTVRACVDYPLDVGSYDSHLYVRAQLDDGAPYGGSPFVLPVHVEVLP